MGTSSGTSAHPPDPPPESAWPDPYGFRGQTIGQYAVHEVIGGGGMGVVYRAEDTRLRRTVALKFLPPTLRQEAAAAARFLAEARAASALDHPNICTVHEIGETADGHPFIAMAYCPGASLRARLEAGPMPADEAAALAAQVARGLHRAHQAGIVHRDVKPGNVMVTPEGQAKLVDFGVARIGDSMLTQTGASIGTVSYMSPEQTRGEAVDARTDQWALGVMLHEMLTGERPFRGGYDQAVVYAILHEEPPPMGDAPAPLAAVVARCLQKNPADRYPDADALADALDAARKGREERGPAVPATRPTGRARLGWAAGGAGALVLAVVAMLAWPAADDPDAVATASGLQQVAVLPFANVGGDPANQAFIDGLAYTVGATLTEMEQFSDRISVLPTDDARAQETRTLGEAAQALGADVIVSGSVQRTPERVRLTIEVYDAASDRLLGSRVLDKTGTDLLAIQDSVVLDLASLLELELNEAARTALAAGGTSSPEAFDLYIQGRGSLQNYEDEAVVDRAVSLFERAVVADDAYALAWAGLGEASWRKYRLTNDTTWARRAAEAGERAVALDPDLPPVRVALGTIYLGTGRYADAERELREAIALDPTDAQAHHQLAGTFYYLDRFDEAVTEYRRAIALKPGYWGFYNSLGNIHLRTGRFRESIPLYERVLELRPDNAWGYTNLGDAYLGLGRPDSAAYWFRRGTQANPSAAGPTATAFVGLGQVDYQRRAYAEAVRSFRRAAALDSSDTITWFRLGNALYLQGQRPAAHAAWLRVVEVRRRQLDVNPNDVDALGDLAHIYAFTGRPGQARAALARLVALPQPRVDSSVRIAWVYERLGDRASALASLRDAFARGLDPVEIEQAPWLDDLRDDPRYVRALRSAPPS
ncbi:protein kinase domain-containing protein [Rubrivirga sp. IMCC43871]|uniref:protein kinase domain-containing protein n=1 Tax=Rubrivirga sp. IMCC43871 TaxID=3391575 RepID=UPI00398FA18A